MSGAESSERVAVTGAAGFLGSALCAHLAASGFGVRALVRDPERAEAVSEGVERAACVLPDGVDPVALDAWAFENLLERGSDLPEYLHRAVRTE